MKKREKDVLAFVNHFIAQKIKDSKIEKRRLRNTFVAVIPIQIYYLVYQISAIDQSQINAALIDNLSQRFSNVKINDSGSHIFINTYMTMW